MRQGPSTASAATWTRRLHITGRPWTCHARSAALRTRAARWQAWAVAPMAYGRLADAETTLRRAQEIFQRTGAAEAAEVTAELEALARPQQAGQLLQSALIVQICGSQSSCFGSQPMVICYSDRWLGRNRTTRLVLALGCPAGPDAPAARMPAQRSTTTFGGPVSQTAGIPSVARTLYIWLPNFALDSPEGAVGEIGQKHRVAAHSGRHNCAADAHE
jgi:hypothetical protein